MAELLAVRGIEKTDNAFRAELVRVAERLGANPGYLAAVISFESAGSFDPAQKNLGGGSAIGLIQFMPFAARKLGTTSAELANMTGVEQLAFVEKFYRMASPGNRFGNIRDHYLAVFAPSGVGKPPGSALPYKGKQYEANKALDTNADGVITVEEAAFPVIAIVRAAERRPPVAVDMSEPATPARGAAAPLAAGMVRLDLPGPRSALRKAGAVALVAAAAYAAATMIEAKKKNGKAGPSVGR